MLAEIKSLTDLFTDHSSVLEELGESLRRQKEAVIHWDLAALAREQRVHNQLLARLRVFDAARVSGLEKLAHALGLGGRPSMSAVLGAITDQTGQTLRSSHERLLAIAGVVKELYRENHRYLAHTLQGVDQSLSVLRAAKQQGTVYTGDAAIAQSSMFSGLVDQNV